jgi:hypothetical protein
MVTITYDMAAPEYTLREAENEPLRTLMSRWNFATGKNAVHDARNALDSSRKKRNLSPATYAPFVRLALVRYQPHALVASKVSRVVLADFAQLTPDRARWSLLTRSIRAPCVWWCPAWRRKDRH